jgi:hypothetical protein
MSRLFVSVVEDAGRGEAIGRNSAEFIDISKAESSRT